jgi:hypothetical protein
MVSHEASEICGPKLYRCETFLRLNGAFCNPVSTYATISSSIGGIRGDSICGGPELSPEMFRSVGCSRNPPLLHDLETGRLRDALEMLTSGDVRHRMSKARRKVVYHRQEESINDGGH